MPLCQILCRFFTLHSSVNIDNIFFSKQWWCIVSWQMIRYRKPNHRPLTPWRRTTSDLPQKGSSQMKIDFVSDFKDIQIQIQFFGSSLILFQSRFNHVFADKSRKSRHDQKIVEKTYHDHVFVIFISITITSRISWSLTKVTTPTFSRGLVVIERSMAPILAFFKQISGFNFQLNSSGCKTVASAGVAKAKPLGQKWPAELF